MDGGEERFGQFIGVRGEAVKLFEFVEKAFDAVAAPIEFLVGGELLGTGTDG